MQSLMGETPCSLAASLKIIIVSHAKREWFEFTVRQWSLVLMQSLMGETPCSLAASLINKFSPFSA
ncbi:hypothetical protein [Moorena producens]|uniref:hypothetical protein n=1 Tax=Moorena producens TaxID=1155739 RepID=UPI0011EA6A10|nr:hypothetical protein [Moorena producens]